MADLNIVESINREEQRIRMPEQILGKGLLMPFNPTNSGARKIMLSTQVDHRLELLNPEPPLVGTGYENKFGEYSSSFTKADGNYEVVAKISKFSFNPDHHYYLIIKNLDTGIYGVLERISYHHITETYGYLFNNKVLDTMHPGYRIKPNQTVKKSLAYDEFDNRQDGVNLLTTYMALELNKEDGIIVSETSSKKLAAPLLKRIPIIVNDNDIPLNIYGDDSIYKSMPNIGEEIKGGVLCAMRREKKEESLFTQSYNRLKTILMSDDKFIAKGKVIDINIYCNNPENLADSYYNQQLKVYYDENIRFINELISVLEPLREAGVKFTYDLEKLYFNNKRIHEGGQYIKDRPFSNTIIEVVVLEENKLEIGDKISNRYGGKGVVSIILPDHMMPQLDNGEYVEVIFNTSTCINRENAGQLFETSINHCSNRLLDYMVMHLMDESDSINLYQKYVSLITPQQAQALNSYIQGLDTDDMSFFLQSIIQDSGIMVRTEPISDNMDIDRLNRIYQEFPYLTQYKITVPIKNSNGGVRYVEARRPIVCGKQYIYRLKQYAEEKFSATSLSSTNIRNENSRSSAKKSYKTKHTKTPVKFGEMETGNLLHLGAENVIINLLLYSASPHGRRLAEELLTGDPFNIDIKLDETAKNRSVEILNTYLLTMGLRLRFEKIRKVKRCPVSFSNVVTAAPRLKTPVWFVDERDQYVVAYLEKAGTQRRSPVRFTPVEFIK